jgi:hypothetical protein
MGDELLPAVNVVVAREHRFPAGPSPAKYHIAIMKGIVFVAEILLGKFNNEMSGLTGKAF